MDKYLIKNTTREEREKIVLEALGLSSIDCDAASDGYDMYIPYIEGEKELKEITMEFKARYLTESDVVIDKRVNCDFVR